LSIYAVETGVYEVDSIFDGCHLCGSHRIGVC
jgi:hypothetical protein